MPLRWIEVGRDDPRRNDGVIVDHPEDPIPELGNATKRMARGRIASIRFRALGKQQHPLDPSQVDAACRDNRDSVSAQRKGPSVQWLALP